MRKREGREGKGKEKKLKGRKEGRKGGERIGIKGMEGEETGREWRKAKGEWKKEKDEDREGRRGEERIHLAVRKTAENANLTKC